MSMGMIPDITDVHRREYIVKHNVEAAITAATTKVLVRRPDDPVVQIGKCLRDPDHVVPAGKTFTPALQYVQEHGVTAAVAAAVKSVVKAMPKDPLVSIGSKLAPTLAPTPSSELSGTAAAVQRGLTKRPSMDELQSRNILKSSVQGKAETLQHQLAADTLAKSLANRPTIEQLADQNIHKSAVQDKAEALAHAMAADNLAKSLATRPDVDVLAEGHIYRSALQDRAEHLRHTMAADAVSKGLGKRPSVAQMEERNLLKSAASEREEAIGKAAVRTSLDGALQRRASAKLDEQLLASRILQRPHVSVYTRYRHRGETLPRAPLDECVALCRQSSDCLFCSWTLAQLADDAEGHAEGDAEGPQEHLLCRAAFQSGAGAAAHLRAAGGTYMQALPSSGLVLVCMTLVGSTAELSDLRAHAPPEVVAACSVWEVWDDFHSPALVASGAPTAFCPLTLQPTFTMLERSAAEPLLHQCMYAAKQEADCLSYGWAMHGDQLTCRQAYRSGKGVAAHLANVGALVGRLLDEGAVSLTSIELHGPADEIADARVGGCDALGCAYWTALDGGFATLPAD